MIKKDGAVCYNLEWQNSKVFFSNIIFIVPIRNSKRTIKAAIKSILSQKCEFEIGILILDDNSNDFWQEEIEEEISTGKIAIASCKAGSSWKIRNLGKKIVDEYFTNYIWLCRLDSDDTLVSQGVVSQMIEGISKENHEVLWVLASNLQNENGILVNQYGNRAKKTLLNENFLLKRLEGMSKGDFTCELPSCNIWLKRGFNVYYPAVESAEDHWLITYLLIFFKEKACLLPDVLHTNYSLTGKATIANKKKLKHLKARKMLYEQAKTWIEKRDRYNYADLLRRVYEQDRFRA